MANAQTLRLPLKLRTLVREHGPDEVRPCVRCPVTGRTVSASGCTSCVRMQAVDWDPNAGGAVTCRIDDIEPCPPKRPLDRRADLAEAAARKTLAEVAPPATVCLDANTSVRRARALLAARDLEAVPVVDRELHVLGIVTRADLLAARLDAPVERVLSAEPRTLPEDAPVAHAIALMAYERVHHVPIVTDEGELVGVWDATAALRWTAERMGYSP